MAAGPGLRIGHAEREATAASLREHYALGRLTIEEFQQRLDAAFAAKTDLDLARITGDLPHVPTPAGAWPPPRPVASPQRDDARSGRADGQGSRSLRALAWAAMNFALFAIVAILLIGLFRPFGWLGTLMPRPLIILIAILVFLRQLVRRAIRGGRLTRPRGRRRF